MDRSVRLGPTQAVERDANACMRPCHDPLWLFSSYPRREHLDSHEQSDEADRRLSTLRSRPRSGAIQ
jgi:hypothetical protein